MKIHLLHKEQFIERPLQDVFSFFERPENLAQITPAWLGFRIVTPAPILMKMHTIIEYGVNVMGARIRWKSLISEYEPPWKFVDEQLKGPYTFWRHTHGFTEVNGGTLVSDDVQYVVPLGVLGAIAQRIVVHRQLESIFAYRAEMIDTIFRGGEFPGSELSGIELN
jgi:ligand-binding SRPBCC domain-containing protein